VVISASHNPSHDNGIKILSATGEKVSDTMERDLERGLRCIEPAPGPDLPTTDLVLKERYRDYLLSTHHREHPLRGRRIVVDAANGAASGLAESFLSLLGADTESIASAPDGDNINAGVGATAPQRLADTVRDRRADAGLALDGDADRVILATESGRILNGDDILLAWARELAAEHRLDRRVVVATVMSNLGLERALARDGITVERCPVGDRAVWETMRRVGAVLGGEQSGHIICSHFGVSGDGLLTGSHLLAAAASSDRTLDQLSDLETLPQVLVNCPVHHRTPLDAVPEIAEAVRRTERQLGDRGRLLLRYSGTEPLVRIMVEGENDAEIAGMAADIAEVIRRSL
jgi:phosphoglucosamine mutase